MKRLFALLLAVVLTVSMTACAVMEDVVQQQTIYGKMESDSGKEETRSGNVGRETEGTAEPEVDAADAIGSYADGTYRNDLLGIQGEFDDTWYVASAEERMEILGVIAEDVTNEDIAEMLRSSGAAMDFYAIRDGGYYSINIMLEKLNPLQSAIVSEEAYIEAAMKNLPTALESINVVDHEVEVTAVSIGGKDHPAVHVSGKQNGLAFYELQMVIKAGQYMGIITAACYEEDVTSDLMAMFAEK